MRDEIFGPVVSIIADEAEAMATVNHSAFGLKGAVFTDDVNRAYSVARICASAP